MSSLLDFTRLRRDLATTALSHVTDDLIHAVRSRLKIYTHGEMTQWESLIKELPTITPSVSEFERELSIGDQSDIQGVMSKREIQLFVNRLKSLHPWRKGPIRLFDILIDTEWRSDWKWDRVKPHIDPLKNRTVLDVGCGNGYHCFRMLSQKPKLVLGIDPSQKFLAQFSVIKKYLPHYPVHLLPIGIEDLPDSCQQPGFDTIFSMGVLYHRRSPIDHLLELKALLNNNGQLVLETLVIDGDENSVLVPRGRYAQMRNVWFIPSASALEKWLLKCGFRYARTVDINQTSLEEQRSTDWMTFHSLQNYLDPHDTNKTIEGYPAPKRAIIVAG